jgi:hypothetical protein
MMNPQPLVEAYSLVMPLASDHYLLGNVARKRQTGETLHERDQLAVAGEHLLEEPGPRRGLCVGSKSIGTNLVWRA